MLNRIASMISISALVVVLAMFAYTAYGVFYPFTAKSTVALVAVVTLFLFLGLPMLWLRETWGRPREDEREREKERFRQIERARRMINRR